MNEPPEDTLNAQCLKDITMEDDPEAGKQETWLVYIIHGFTASIDSAWLEELRESVVKR